MLEERAALSAAKPTTATVFAEHGARVWRFLRYMGVPERDLHDASQDVFVVVHRRIGEFDGAAKVESWLYAICFNVARTYRRKGRTREIGVEELPEREVDERGAAELVERQVLNRALDALDELHRAVFVLREVEELPMSEVARAVGCPLFTAYSRHRTARMRLQRILRELEVDR